MVFTTQVDFTCAQLLTPWAKVNLIAPNSLIIARKDFSNSKDEELEIYPIGYFGCLRLTIDIKTGNKNKGKGNDAGLA